VGATGPHSKVERDADGLFGAGQPAAAPARTAPNQQPATWPDMDGIWNPVGGLVFDPKYAKPGKAPKPVQLESVHCDLRRNPRWSTARPSSCCPATRAVRPRTRPSSTDSRN
jgi:hypothetical protein